MTVTIYTNTSVFTGDPSAPLAEAVAVQADKIFAVGSEAEVRAACAEVPTCTEVDLGGAFTMPGLIEAHTHLTMFGQALSKVPLRDCQSLEEIHARLTEAREAQPDATYLLGVGWRFEALPEARPTAAMIDEVISDIPVLLDANDLHSTWVNTRALEAMGITADTPNPVGGEIVRDHTGVATGFMLETAAVTHCWGYVTQVASDADRDDFLRRAFNAYLASGVTGSTEMALDEAGLATLIRWVQREGNLPFPVAAHWFLQPSGDKAQDLAQVRRAEQVRDEVAALPGNTTLRIAGVKFTLDGVIDACTAAMRAPYANGTLPAPIWSEAAATPVAIAADRAGMQLALHAIGDAASELALRLVEACITANGDRAGRMPRIEHLESVTDEVIERMAQLGVVASVQPVHCDPAIMGNWKAVLGDERAERGFPWHKFREAGVPLALGTDAPTAPHEALDNLFIALTARSVLEPGPETYHPERVFQPAQALESYSVIPARTSWSERGGILSPGEPAHLTVLSAHPLHDDPDTLLNASVLRTIVFGEEKYNASAPQEQASAQ